MRVRGAATGARGRLCTTTMDRPVRADGRGRPTGHPIGRPGRPGAAAASRCHDGRGNFPLCSMAHVPPLMCRTCTLVLAARQPLAAAARCSGRPSAQLPVKQGCDAWGPNPGRSSPRRLVSIRPAARGRRRTGRLRARQQPEPCPASSTASACAGNRRVCCCGRTGCSAYEASRHAVAHDSDGPARAAGSLMRGSREQSTALQLLAPVLFTILVLVLKQLPIVRPLNLPTGRSAMTGWAGVPH